MPSHLDDALINLAQKQSSDFGVKTKIEVTTAAASSSTEAILTQQYCSRGTFNRPTIYMKQKP
jgi:hypothetical protein